MKAKYRHTNIISSNWQSLSQFYQEVFGCIPVPPERKLSGKWLDKGTGIKGARFAGIHLRLPGYGDNGPTLEIYQYSKNLAKSSPAANREGFGHIAFEVDSIQEAVKGKKVIIEPNSPSPGVVVAFIEDNGAPIEFIEVDSSIAEVGI